MEPSLTESLVGYRVKNLVIQKYPEYLDAIKLLESNESMQYLVEDLGENPRSVGVNILQKAHLALWMTSCMKITFSRIGQGIFEPGFTFTSFYPGYCNFTFQLEKIDEA